jgi:hypothetical protein
MNKPTQLLPFVQDLFDDADSAQKATRIVDGILQARSPRLSEISGGMGKMKLRIKSVFPVSWRPLISPVQTHFLN